MTIKWPKSRLAKKRPKMPERPELLKWPDWQKRPQGANCLELPKRPEWPKTSNGQIGQSG